jgi:hypothetical protein
VAGKTEGRLKTDPLDGIKLGEVFRSVEAVVHKATVFDLESKKPSSAEDGFFA